MKEAVVSIQNQQYHGFTRGVILFQTGMVNTFFIKED